MNTLRKNVVYSSVLTVSGYLFSFLTFPYVTRVLGVSNIGICNFVDSIVQYFIFFSMMGITTLGIREVARTKSNEVQLTKTYSSLLTLNLIATIIAVTTLLIATCCVPQLRAHKYMFFVGAAKVFASTLQIEWLFKGLEDFKYITTRTIIIRCIYVLSVFIFVRKSDDYFIYFLLTTGSVLVNALINICYSKRFVKINLREIELRAYYKPFVILGIYMLLTSMYTTFNVAYLGFITDMNEVGYYTTATKLYTIIMSLFTAFTGVMLPRMSALVSEGNISEIKRLTDKSVTTLLLFAIPLIIISEACAPQIIEIIAGPGFEGAIVPMRIVMPLMIVIGLEQIFILQLLTPLKKDTYILTNSIVGASIGILMNVLFVSKLGCIGSSIVWITSETIVLIVAQYETKKLVNIGIPISTITKDILYYLPLILTVWLFNVVCNDKLFSLIFTICIVVIYTIIVQIKYMKSDLLVSFTKKLKNKI